LSFLEFADIRSLVFKNSGIVREGHERWTTFIRRQLSSVVVPAKNAIAAIRTLISHRTSRNTNRANQEIAKSIPLPGSMEPGK
jgi:hypothetical protein